MIRFRPFTSPVLATFVQLWHDAASSEEAGERLVAPILPLLDRSAAPLAVESKRMWEIVDWALRDRQATLASIAGRHEELRQIIRRRPIESWADLPEAPPLERFARQAAVGAYGETATAAFAAHLAPPIEARFIPDVAAAIREGGDLRFEELARIDQDNARNLLRRLTA